MNNHSNYFHPDKCGTQAWGNMRRNAPCPPGYTFPYNSGYGPYPTFYDKNPCPIKNMCNPGNPGTCNTYPLVNPYVPPTPITLFKVNNLVSNGRNRAAIVDPLLINPWGIVVYNNHLWVANNTSDVVTNYDIFGNKLLAQVNVRDAVHNSSHPTGIVVNCTGGFNVTNGNTTKASIFLTCGEHGTVHSYNPLVDPQYSPLVINTQILGTVVVYKGLALADNKLYIADFYGRKIDVYDSNYNRLPGFPFVDGCAEDPIPDDFSPFNIVNIGKYLYVLWAKRDPMVPLHEIDGPGYGYISVYNFDGSFVRRFYSRGVLNAPWAMIPAPIECGFPPGSFLVGNKGDGKINIFNACGQYIMPILNSSGKPFVEEGLRGLAPYYVEKNEIFFSAARNQNADGLIGSLEKDQVINI